MRVLPVFGVTRGEVTQQTSGGRPRNHGNEVITHLRWEPEQSASPHIATVEADRNSRYIKLVVVVIELCVMTVPGKHALHALRKSKE